MPTSSDYKALVSRQHATAPNFMATVAALTKPSEDLQATLATLAAAFDVEVATGTQLDTIGMWVGLPRYVFVPSLGTVTLSDADYRILLLARIARNFWDGGMETMQAILASLFPGSGITVFAYDNQDMSLDIFFRGGTLSTTQLALLTGGLLVPKPEGVRINGVAMLTTPLFGLDRNDSVVAGPDVGYFATYL